MLDINFKNSKTGCCECCQTSVLTKLGLVFLPSSFAIDKLLSLWHFLFFSFLFFVFHFPFILFPCSSASYCATAWPITVHLSCCCTLLDSFFCESTWFTNVEGCLRCQFYLLIFHVKTAIIPRLKEGGVVRCYPAVKVGCRKTANCAL